MESNLEYVKEIKEIDKEKYEFNRKNDSYRNELIDKLLNGGLGDEIKQTINRKEKPIKKNKFLTLLKEILNAL